MDYVADSLIEIYQERDRIGGLRVTYQAPFMRHFTARLVPLDQAAWT